jgi:nitrogen fixation/metabolism regulation signal transduction histidine kinase
MLVLFATAAGALAAFWLSGIAAKRLARDLELSRIEVARAERVLAWGEMARQVAHEIKNPLTPIRLGVQHLRRARHDPRLDYDAVLDENVGRILAEIDRLDEIARSFSRYGSAPADLPPAEAVDVAAVTRDVAGLEQMGDRKVQWRLRGAERAMWAMARKDEMRDVLLNIFENARLAGARRVDISLHEDDTRVTIETVDDGGGIPAEVLPRIFEPHFSTRTTGSGLGLAVTRRLIEAWGGEIAINSEEGKGTRVLILLARSAP